MADLLDCVGNPHQKLRCIHIAGSKGKGSTALFAEAIAHTAGLNTGTFTSPHLENWTERFRIQGNSVSESSLLEAIEKLRPHVSMLRDRYRTDPPTFFDTLTALSLMLFAEARVDLAIIEAGIGARLDATTIAPAIVTCVTTIEKEHTDKLGLTLESIATEKAGVIRTGQPLVLGQLAPVAEKVLRTRAAIKQAPVSQLGRDFFARVERIDTTHTALHFEGHDHELEVTIPQPAPYVTLNAALAVECVVQTQLASNEVIFTQLQQSLGHTCLPARVEILRTDPVVLIDAAHTAISMTHLAEVLATFKTQSFIAVLSLTSTKDVDQVFAPLRSLVSRVIVTRADPTRSMSAGRLANHLGRLWPREAIVTVEDPERALNIAFEQHQELGVGLCVTGSVYLAGHARRVLKGLTCAQ